jgi:hypothetical protein
MLATAIALGFIPVGGVEPQLFRSPVAIGLYADVAAICLWRLVNRFQARRRRPAPQVHRGPAHALVELADELAVDAAHLPQPEPVLARTEGRPVLALTEGGTRTHDGHAGPASLSGNR